MSTFLCDYCHFFRKPLSWDRDNHVTKEACCVNNVPIAIDRRVTPNHCGKFKPYFNSFTGVDFICRIQHLRKFRKDFYKEKELRKKYQQLAKERFRKIKELKEQLK